MAPNGKTTMKLLDQYVLGMHKFVEIPVKSITVDSRYQRDINHKAINRIVNGLDVNLFEPVTVNARRNGKTITYIVLDGQHRIAAAKKLGLASVTCRVVDVDADTEANLFVHLNKNRIYLAPLSTFKAELAAHNPAAREMTDCVAARDLKIGAKDDGSTVVAITALKAIYSRGGTVGIGRVLDTITLSWDEDTEKRFSGHILLGVDAFYRETPKAQAVTVAERLAYTTPVQLMAKATQRWYGWRAVGQTQKGVIDCVGDEIAKTYRKRAVVAA